MAMRTRMYTAPSGSFTLVGHSALLNRGMNAALAVDGDTAYVGSRTDGSHAHAGVLVVDISRPAAPRVVGEIGPPDEGNVGESSRELRVWPAAHLLIVLNFACNAVLHACSQWVVPTSTVRFYDIAGAAARSPRLVATYYPSRTPHEFFLWIDPVHHGRALLYLTTPYGKGDNLLVTDISRARAGRFPEVATWSAPGVGGAYVWLHSLSISPDGRRAYLAYLAGGVMEADTTDLAHVLPTPRIRLLTPAGAAPRWGAPGTHSAVALPGRHYLLTTDEVYGLYAGEPLGRGCPWGWVRLIDDRDPAALKIVGTYKLAPYNDSAYCRVVSQDKEIDSSYSSHNPTVTAHLALISWHAGGLQAVDLGDPTHPRMAASFAPTPLPAVSTEDPALTSGSVKIAFWSYPIIQNGLIYVVDIRNGLYILRYHGSWQREIATREFLEGNSNAGP